MTLREFINGLESQNEDALYADLSNIKGVGPTTASTIVTESDFFIDDLLYALTNISIVDSKGTN